MAAAESKLIIQLSKGAYDATKKVAQIWLPAIGALYFALAQIWHLPAAEQVTGTVVAVDTCLGVLLGISSASYVMPDDEHDGVMNVVTNPDGTQTANMVLNDDPSSIVSKQSVSFKVNTVPASGS